MSDGRQSLSADLAGKIRIEILAEQLKSGEKITEQSMSERYGVSRTPVREALKNLEAEGLIVMIPNRGAFVAGLSDDDLRDLYTLRMVDEMQAIRWATCRATKAEIEAIEESLDFMAFYTERGDAKRMRSINAGFHKRIAAASHNRILIENLSRIQDYIRYTVRVPSYNESSLTEILAEHRAIFDAFKALDTDSAANTMRRHIENSLLRANL
jgi:DNA-binding GntR family transcriptional regulator